MTYQVSCVAWLLFKADLQREDQSRLGDQWAWAGAQFSTALGKDVGKDITDLSRFSFRLTGKTAAVAPAAAHVDASSVFVLKRFPRALTEVWVCVVNSVRCSNTYFNAYTKCIGIQKLWSTTEDFTVNICSLTMKCCDCFMNTNSAWLIYDQNNQDWHSVKNKGQQWSDLQVSKTQFPGRIWPRGRVERNVTGSRGKWVKTQRGHGSSLTMHQSTEHFIYSKAKWKTRSKTNKKTRSYRTTFCMCIALRFWLSVSKNNVL